MAVDICIKDVEGFRVERRGFRLRRRMNMSKENKRSALCCYAHAAELFA